MMSSSPGQEVNRPQRDSCLPALCALWTVDLQLTHVDCSPADTLVHFQGQYLTVCEMDYNILQEGVLRKLNTDTTDLFVLFKPREDQALPRRLAEDNRDSLDDPEVEGGRSQRDETAVLMRDAAIASDDSPAKVASYSFQDKLIYR
ncbi:tudor domain-containing protein 15 [Arapaima gigas]